MWFCCWVGWGNLVLTEAEKALKGQKRWGLISGLSGSSAQCKCLGEQTEYLSGPMGPCGTWGRWDCWPAPLRCHPQLPLKAMALLGGPNYFRNAKRSDSSSRRIILGNHRLHHSPWKTVEQVFKAVSKHNKNEKVMENWQRGVTKRK